MGKLVWSSLVLIATVIVSLILYVVAFSTYKGEIWFNLVMVLCIITFFLGAGLFVSALLVEKAKKNIQ